MNAKGSETFIKSYLFYNKHDFQILSKLISILIFQNMIQRYLFLIKNALNSRKLIAYSELIFNISWRPRKIKLQLSLETVNHFRSIYNFAQTYIRRYWRTDHRFRPEKFSKNDSWCDQKLLSPLKFLFGLRWYLRFMR